MYQKKSFSFLFTALQASSEGKGLICVAVKEQESVMQHRGCGQRDGEGKTPHVSHSQSHHLKPCDYGLYVCVNLSFCAWSLASSLLKGNPLFSNISDPLFWHTSVQLVSSFPHLSGREQTSRHRQWGNSWNRKQGNRLCYNFHKTMIWALEAL